MKKEERIKQVKKMVMQNIQAKDIARMLGISEATVSRYVKEILARDNKNECLHSKICNRYSMGKSISEISFEFGVSRTYVNAVILKNGLKERRVQEERKNLIDENTVFAEKRVKNEKILLYGKRYRDVTETYAPR